MFAAISPANNENKMLMERLKIICGEIYERPRSITEARKN